ncbi:MAG: hypothetical protein IH867_13220, partial [Chloroflexi bacterium]|nr:hypothetical protein [Chloroflexota bacterium]
IALFSTATPASADTAGPVPGFTPDGVNFIPAAGFDGQVIARFTPDGVNQVDTPDSPAIAQQQILAYLNGGNHSPDGVSNLQNNGQTSQVIARFTPDGVNQVETPEGPAIAQQQVLAYMNGGNHSPDGVSNLQNNGQTSQIIARFTPDGVNQVETPEGPAIAQQQVLAYMNGGNHSPDGVSNLQINGQGDASVQTLAYYYAGLTDPSQVG